MKIAAKIDPERQKYYTQQGWWGTHTLLDHWNETVQRYGDRRYVCGDNGVWLTYRQVDDYAGRLAAYLRENGVECGDVAAIQLPNWSAYCVAYVAGLKAGAVLHLISRNTEKSELADLLTRSDAKALICPTSFRGPDYEAMLSNYRRDIPSLRCVLLADEQEPACSGHTTLTQVLKTCRPLDASPEVDPNDVAALLNTSGTTGSPKVVMITHNNILFSEKQFNRELGDTEDDIMFMPAPLHHATGFHHGLIAPMLTGAGVVLQQRFQREQAVQLILREQCTYSMGATPFVYDILQEMERTGVRLPSMKFFLCGGAMERLEPVAPEDLPDGVSLDYRIVGGYNDNAVQFFWQDTAGEIGWNGSICAPLPGAVSNIRRRRSGPPSSSPWRTRTLTPTATNRPVWSASSAASGASSCMRTCSVWGWRSFPSTGWTPTGRQSPHPIIVNDINFCTFPPAQRAGMYRKVPGRYENDCRLL